MNKYKMFIFSILFILCLFGCAKIKRQFYFHKHKNHIEFIKFNPNKIESAHKLAVLSTTFGKNKTSELFELLSDSIKNSEDGRLIYKYLLLNKDPQIGDKYIDFEMKTPNGSLIKLSDFQGEIILLDFWASWCKGCVYQLSYLSNTYDKFHNKGFEIVAISYDENKEDWIKMIEKKGLKWPCRLPQSRSD